MPSKNILIASVLKPADDIRSYHKIGRSLQKLFPESHFYYIGQGHQKGLRSEGNIHFWEHRFARLSFRRLLFQWQFLKFLFQKRPRLLLISTHELLPAAVLAKVFLKIPFIYDLQENYYANIRYLPTFPKLLRRPLAVMVRAMERFCTHFSAAVFLAEACYEEELASLLKNKHFALLENKALPLMPPQATLPTQSPALRLLLAGTLSEAYGLFRALDFVEKLRQSCEAELLICGFCSQEAEYVSLLEKIKEKNHIRIIGGRHLVAPAQIQAAMQKSDFLLLPYNINPVFARRIPSKLFEALALDCKVLIQNNPFWEAQVAVWQVQEQVFFVDFETFDTAQAAFSEKYWRKTLQENSSQASDFVADRRFCWGEAEEAKISLILSKTDIIF